MLFYHMWFPCLTSWSYAAGRERIPFCAFKDSVGLRFASFGFMTPIDTLQLSALSRSCASVQLRAKTLLAVFQPLFTAAANLTRLAHSWRPQHLARHSLHYLASYCTTQCANTPTQPSGPDPGQTCSKASSLRPKLMVFQPPVPARPQEHHPQPERRLGVVHGSLTGLFPPRLPQVARFKAVILVWGSVHRVPPGVLALPRCSRPPRPPAYYVGSRFQNRVQCVKLEPCHFTTQYSVEQSAFPTISSFFWAGFVSNGKRGNPADGVFLPTDWPARDICKLFTNLDLP